MDAPGSSWRIFQAMLVPVMPEPTITYLEVLGRLGVLRWSEMGRGGVCQYALVGCGRGSPTGILVCVIVILWMYVLT